MHIFHHIHKRKFWSVFILSSLVLGLSATALFIDTTTVDARAASTVQISLPFTYSFKVDGTLEEAGNLEQSWSPYWWLNSGAYLYIKNGVGSTVQGSLPANNKWRLLYAKNDPGETDNGYHPQNIFRLILRTSWQNVSEEMFYRINTYNLSSDAHRTGSNGLLLMNRYLDDDDLYYAGLRVDGYAVIKKKIKGTYYTMAYKQVLPGKFDRTSNPNLIPTKTWIGVKTEVRNLDASTVSIKLYTDVGRTGTWTLAAEATDNGSTYGGQALLQQGHGGVRTDFMDADFDDYRLVSLP